MDTSMVIGLIILIAITSSLVTWVVLSKRISSLREEKIGLEANYESSALTLSELKTDFEEIEKEKSGLATDLSSTKESLATEKQALVSTKEQLEQTQNDVKEIKTKNEQLQETLSTTKSELSALKAEQEERDNSHQKQIEQFEDQKESLKKEFENLANKIFEERSKRFSENSESSLDKLLKPFQEKMDGFQKRVNEIHTDSVKGNTNLEAEIKKVLDVGLKMQEDATNLTAALKGDSQQRGAWGEAQLERTLQMSGLMEGDHYDSQESFKDPEGKNKRTDYVVKLPDGKHIIIDSKVNLPDYDRAVSAKSEVEAKVALKAHVLAVKKHIDDLSSKDYTHLIGVNSPSFVLMFMPIEPAYIEALKHDKELFNYGYQKGIVLVSHTTLIPILRTVSNLWMLDQSNNAARELGDKALEIFNQVCLVAERMHKLGGSLKTVGNHYTDAVTALIGQQGLHGKVERFSQLSSKAKKSMPELTPVHLDVDDDRLLLDIKPVEEELIEAESE